MEKNEVKINPDDTEISFGKIVGRIKDTWKFLLKRWWVLMLSVVIGGGTGWLYCFIIGPTYTAHCTFTVQGQSASSSLLSSALSLASSLGISGKGGKSSSYDNNFFANLMSSRRIVKETFLREETVNGKKDILANFYIGLNELDEKWEGDKRLDKFLFKHNKVAKLTRLEDSVLNYIYDKVSDENLSVKYDEDQPFNSASFTSTDFEFSKKMMKQLVDNTSAFYLHEMYKLNDDNLQLAEHRLDSIANAIRELDAKVARLKDFTQSTIKQSGLLDLNAAIRDQGLLNVQYSSAVNNYELAKVSLLTEAPILDIIDDPLFSTESIIPPVILITIGGAIFLFVVTAGSLIMWRFVKDTIDKENN